MKQSMKKIVTTFIMALMILTGIAVFPVQKAEAAEPVLSVDNQWTDTLTSSEKTILYQFTVPSDGVLTWNILNGNPRSGYDQNINYSIMDNNLVSLANSRVYGGGNYISSDSIVLSAGVYYIKLNSNDISNFTYKIRLNLRAYGVNDQMAGSFSSPQTIAVGQKIVGALTATDREDWYKINISKAGNYIHTIVAEGQFRVELRNGASTLYCRDISGSSNTPYLKELTCELEAGTYYIRISPHGSAGNNPKPGKYEFTVTTAPCAHTYKSKTVKPTYFSKGYTKKTCTKCGEVVKDSYVAKRKIAKETIKTLNGGKKKLTLTWKTIRDVTGYEIRYSTNRTFKKSVKTTVIKKRSTGKKTITKLKSKKTYYVQVRAYATKGKTTVYGKWSNTKKVKVK